MDPSGIMERRRDGGETQRRPHGPGVGSGVAGRVDPNQRRDLALRFAGELAGKYGCAVDVALHAPDREGDQRNFHAHLLATTRKFPPAPSAKNPTSSFPTRSAFPAALRRRGSKSRRSGRCGPSRSTGNSKKRRAQNGSIIARSPRSAKRPSNKSAGQSRHTGPGAAGKTRLEGDSDGAPRHCLRSRPPAPRGQG